MDEPAYIPRPDFKIASSARQLKEFLASKDDLTYPELVFFIVDLFHAIMQRLNFIKERRRQCRHNIL